ncbi:MAG: TetR/AcrR family transcriptional regulator [Syntrophobacteraceae bacterium]|jgi:AcrR family transcriptional regulator|nr:TetR/AcrR family transcriptional regulator [Syntrophobacteraceae bacterium]
MKKPREVRREEILTAAVNEFLDNGYEGASVDGIARRAELTKGGIYHHFRSKAEILLAANERFQEPVTSMMQTAESTPDAAQAISGFIAAYLEHWATHPREMVFIFLSFTKLLGSPELWTLYERRCHRLRVFARGLYHRGMEAGCFRPHDPGRQSLALLAAMDGVLGYLIMDRELDRGQVIRDFQQFFVVELMDLGAGRMVRIP